MSKWRVLDFLKFSGLVSAKDGHLFAADRSAPLSDVGTILVGPRCTLHASLIDRAAAFDVMIVVCDWRGIPTSAILPWSSNTRVGARHLAQANLTAGRRKNAWMQIIKAKIAGQSANVIHSDEASRALARLRAETRSGDPTNNEAQAARIYWQHVFADEPNFVRDARLNSGRNALLNYGYTILRGHTIRHIVAAGLWPTLGLWHHNRSNVFALADDLIEPFRPAVDSTVQGLIDLSRAEPSQLKRALVEASEQHFGSDNATVNTSIGALAQRFAKFVEGDEKQLRVPQWRGPQ